MRDHFERVEWFDKWDVLKAGIQPGQSTNRTWQYVAGMRCILNEPRFHSDRSLLVFDDALFIDKSAWAELVASTNKLADGSKVPFTCANWIPGAVELLMLRALPEEEYWYYFKSFAFDGADPRDHQQIAAVGRDISRHLVESQSLFLDARVLGELLRANIEVRFWSRVLEAIVRCRGQPCESGTHIAVLLDILPFSECKDGYGSHDYSWRPKLTVQEWKDGYGSQDYWWRPKLTVQGLLAVSPASSSRTFCLHLRRETLYTDNWYNLNLIKEYNLNLIKDSSRKNLAGVWLENCDVVGNTLQW